jgi:hypothetical protein
MIGRVLAFAALAAGLPASAGAQDFNPVEIDLEKMINCEMNARDYNAFAMWFATDPGAAELLGLTQVMQGNPLLSQFALSKSLSAFGHSADSIAFTATGPLAMLPDVDARELAAALGVTPVHDTADKFLGEKVLVEETEDLGGTKLETTVSLNVSTVDTHPGVTLAGCSYRVEVK